MQQRKRQRNDGGDVDGRMTQRHSEMPAYHVKTLTKVISVVWSTRSHRPNSWRNETRRKYRRPNRPECPTASSTVRAHFHRKIHTPNTSPLWLQLYSNYSSFFAVLISKKGHKTENKFRLQNRKIKTNFWQLATQETCKICRFFKTRVKLSQILDPQFFKSSKRTTVQCSIKIIDIPKRFCCWNVCKGNLRWFRWSSGIAFIREQSWRKPEEIPEDFPMFPRRKFGGVPLIDLAFR
jgi:hypothetical protein